MAKIGERKYISIKRILKAKIFSNTLCRGRAYSATVGSPNGPQRVTQRT